MAALAPPLAFSFGGDPLPAGHDTRIVNVRPVPEEVGALFGPLRLSVRDKNQAVDTAVMNAAMGVTGVHADGGIDIFDKILPGTVLRSLLTPEDFDDVASFYVNEVDGITSMWVPLAGTRRSFFFTTKEVKTAQSAIFLLEAWPHENSIFGIEYGPRGVYFELQFFPGTGTIQLTGNGYSSSIGFTPDRFQRYYLIWDEMRGTVYCVIETPLPDTEEHTSTILFSIPLSSFVGAFPTNRPQRVNANQAIAYFGTLGASPYSFATALHLKHVAFATDVDSPLIDGIRPGGFATLRRSDEIVRFEGWSDPRRAVLSPWFNNAPPPFAAPPPGDLEGAGAVSTVLPGGAFRMSLSNPSGGAFAMFREEPGLLNPGSAGFLFEGKISAKARVFHRLILTPTRAAPYVLTGTTIKIVVKDEETDFTFGAQTTIPSMAAAMTSSGLFPDLLFSGIDTLIIRSLVDMPFTVLGTSTCLSVLGLPSGDLRSSDALPGSGVKETKMLFSVYDSFTIFKLALVEKTPTGRSLALVKADGSFVLPNTDIDWDQAVAFRLVVDVLRDRVELFLLPDVDLPVLSIVLDRPTLPGIPVHRPESNPNPHVAFGIDAGEIIGTLDIYSLDYSYMFHSWEQREINEPTLATPPFTEVGTGADFGGPGGEDRGPLIPSLMPGGPPGDSPFPVPYHNFEDALPDCGSLAFTIKTNPGQVHYYTRLTKFQINPTTDVEPFTDEHGAAVEAKLKISYWKPAFRTGVFVDLDDTHFKFRLGFVDTYVGKFATISISDGGAGFEEHAGTDGLNAKLSFLIDWTKFHTYRLERRIRQGLYVFVDSEETPRLIVSEFDFPLPLSTADDSSVSFGHLSDEGATSCWRFVRTYTGTGFEMTSQFNRAPAVVQQDLIANDLLFVMDSGAGTLPVLPPAPPDPPSPPPSAPVGSLDCDLHGLPSGYTEVDFVAEFDTDILPLVGVMPPGGTTGLDPTPMPSWFKLFAPANSGASALQIPSFIDLLTNPFVFCTHFRLANLGENGKTGPELGFQADGSNYLFVEALTTDGNFAFKMASTIAGVNVIDTGIPLDTNPHRFRISGDGTGMAGTLLLDMDDGVFRTTIPASWAPAVLCFPTLWVFSSNGAVVPYDLRIDTFSVKYGTP